MNIQAMHHRPKSNYCYAVDKKHIHIRFRAALKDVDKVTLVYADKYEWPKSTKVEMKIELSDEIFEYHAATIIPPNKRLSYYFEVEKSGKTYYFTEWGFQNELFEEEIHLHFFNFPYLNEVDVHEVPEWVKGAVFYQIFPERFNNGDESLNRDDIVAWDSKPERDNFFGGDLKGIEDKVEYLADLGINAIYMTPVFEATTNHKYDTTDYMKIDPHFGDVESFKSLVKTCHEHGIKVVLDAVFNHSGYGFEPFQDVIKNGKNSKYYDWFYVKSLPITKDPLSYETFGFEPLMPKLNTANPEVKKYLLDVSRYWIEEVDIDGWRLDVANEIDHTFWRDFRKVVKEAKKDAYIVGEIWHESSPWLMGDQFDAIMNYPFTRACMQYFANQNTENKKFKELINNTIVRNTDQVNSVMLNLLDSHDTPRFLTQCKVEKDNFLLAAAFQLTYVGAPSVYYGTEIGMEGEGDPDCRRAMIWDESKWDMNIYNTYKKLITLRNEQKALKKGDFKWVDTDKVIGFIREYEDNRVMVLINNDSKSKKINIKVSSNVCKDLFEEKEIAKTAKGLEIQMDAKSFKVIEL